MNHKTYADFLMELAKQESTNRYSAIEPKTLFLGKYQMGEAALVDTGYYRRDGHSCDNQFKNSFWTGKDGVHSKADFLNNPQAQENAIRAYMEIQWRYIICDNADVYVGQVRNGILLTPSGLLAGAHLKGHGDLARFAKKGIDSRDGNKVRVSKYVKQFASYEVPFTPRSKVTGVKKSKNRQPVSYQIDGKWIPIDAAIQMVRDQMVDAVIATSRSGNLYLRTRPDSDLKNNLVG